MSKLIDTMKLNVVDSNSIIDFETTGRDTWDVWDRYLTIEGKKGYHIGNICDTCAFFFEKLDVSSKITTSKEVSNQLKEGITRLDDKFIKKIYGIVPKNQYYVNLIELMPSSVIMGGENDYFSEKKMNTWKVNSSNVYPHNPKTIYYRGDTIKIEESKEFYEFIVPMFSHEYLDKKTLCEYKNLIKEGNRPTALALSILDIKNNYDTEHWCLTHYLIDGHHKVNSASLLNKPITVISFLAINEGISTFEDINLIQGIQNA